jgi:hypothetical protein
MFNSAKIVYRQMVKLEVELKKWNAHY